MRPSGKPTFTTQYLPAETLARVQAEALGFALRDLAATGACARVQTADDARAVVRDYLASLGPAIAAILRGGEDASGLPVTSGWILHLSPPRVGLAQRGSSIRAVATMLVQGLLDHCGTGPSASADPVRAPVKTLRRKTAPVPTIPGVVATPAPAPALPVKTLRSVPSADLPALRASTLRAATTEALALAGLSVCSDIAYLPSMRERAIRGVVVAFRNAWTPQMVAVMGGGTMPASPDGPRWYREMMAQVGGQPAARQMLAYVLEQMPSAIVDLCSVIRRQSERE